MIWHVIIAFTAILVGMAISVGVFGTGGKRKKVFRDIYFSVEDCDGIGVVYTKTGEYSAVLTFENPVQKYSANVDSYYEFSNLFTAIASTLGEGYALHKQDIFCRRSFDRPGVEEMEFLSKTYFSYFKGRRYTDCCTYLVITQEARKGKLISFDARKWRDFQTKIRKVKDQLRDGGVPARFLDAGECDAYIDRFFAMDFNNETVSMTNFKVDDETIAMGDRKCRVFSLVDVDSAGLPSLIRPFNNIEVNNSTMPVDIMSSIDSIPDAETVIYNQMMFIPNQKRELSMLEKKKNRHASIPNPSNQIAVEDIKRVQEVVARDGKQLVYTHFNLVVCCSGKTDMQKPVDHLENMFGRLGIHISRRAYNQLELFVNSFPGNCYGMSPDYDRFLTLSDAASCLMYKERLQRSEDTPLKIHYTDRQGIPVAIDITGKEGRNKLTDNSNFFCLGPSGSGKSFHINSVVRQLHEQGTDVVMVDTGHSYEGLCEYLGGKYISYTEEKPITMNPFNITREEINIEKINFLKNLILQIWKGSDATATDFEMRIAEQMINEYYDAYFNGFSGYDSIRREAVTKKLVGAAKRKAANLGLTAEELIAKVPDPISMLEERRKALKVTGLSFNTFYEYSVEALDIICLENNITEIDYDKYAYMIQPFYKGGKHEKTLNEQVDTTLFNGSFISL